MDFNSLRDQVSNLTLYDLKAGVRKVQNAVMNYTELEAKVREATNNEPWGASTTLMQDIANGTYNYQGLNEIMPILYKRFTEKTAEEWRQIYKALQLLEFLIKNGSERVVDDARGHISLLKMLRQFQFYDQNGKDQGLNVRNRAKELAELLGDVDKIRAERKKARANKNKYGGVEGGAGFGSGMSGGGSRYGGFGSEDADYGGYSGGVYGDGGGFGGQSDMSYQGSSSRRENFEEYDEGDDTTTTSTRTAGRRTAASTTTSSSAAGKKPAAPPKAKEPEVDLLGFDDSSAATPASAAAAGGDDFDDFVSADAPAAAAPTSTFSAISPPPMATTANVGSSTTFAAPKPVAATPQPAGNYGNIMQSFSSAPASGTVTPSMASTGFASPPPPSSSMSAVSTGSFQPMQPTNAAQAPQPSGYQPAQPNYFTSVRAGPSGVSTPVAGSSTMASPSPLSGGAGGGSGMAGSKPTAASKPAGGDAFASLWGSASASAGVKKPAVAGPNLNSMAKEKTAAGIWGAPAAQKPAYQQQAPQQTGQSRPSAGGGLDDLLG